MTMSVRLALAGAVLSASGVAAVPAVAAPDAMTIAAIYRTAATTAGCGDRELLARDLAAIQLAEQPDGVLFGDGRVLNADGSQLVGDLDLGVSRGPFSWNDEAGGWAVYGQGGNVDRLDDSAEATARMLCANGYTGDRSAAIARHNGSGPAARAYAVKVLAAEVALVPSSSSSSSASPARAADRRGIAGRLADTVVGGLLDRLHWLAGDNRTPVELAPLVQTVDVRARAAAGLGPAAVRPSTGAMGERIAVAARGWVGADYHPGIPAQCAFFVREVLAGVGIDPPVTNTPIDGAWPASTGTANGFGPEAGTVIRAVDQLQAGDVVMWANTYGNWAPGTITHVGIYVGGGLVVDRPTASAPVQLRPLATFTTFVAGIRLNPPNQGAQP